MEKTDTSEKFEVGGMTGRILPKWDKAVVADIISRLHTNEVPTGFTVLAGGRNIVLQVGASHGGWSGSFAIKSFGRRSFLRDASDAGRGTRARRTFQTACLMMERGVGTPEPVCYLEKWTGGRLKASYYISVFEEGAVSFRDELIRLFRDQPECELFMNLMQAVAEGVAGMHDAGVFHRDLGNQNILLQSDGSRWSDVKFMDLNRSILSGSVSPASRARDISRIYLPSDLHRIFIEMYFMGEVPPKDFLRQERFYRWMFTLHTRTRSIRHPFKWVRRYLLNQTDERGYPFERDMWIWDSRSGQPISVLRPKDRRKWMPLTRHIDAVRSSARIYKGAREQYDALLSSCYSSKIEMTGKTGIALGFDSGNDEKELELLQEIGRVPVQVRFMAGQPQRWAKLGALVKQLADDGHEINISLLQDRASVLDPDRWHEFVKSVAGLVADNAVSVEACHAVNRVKWGFWDFDAYPGMIDAVKNYFGRNSGVRITGPAVIDFEYHFIPAVLDLLPEGFRFDALSHHLYVDRRGAPEIKQSGFSTLEKAVLLKAIARTHAGLSDRVVVSEVNWPIAGTGVWSPVNSPRESPGVRHNDPSVSEEDYADYMIRYLLICLCSGMVDQVFWWRLVSRGFGLVDDTYDDNWRKRPAYLMMKQFVKMMDGAVFQSRRRLGEDGGLCAVFEDRGGSTFAACYSEKGEVNAGPPFNCARVLDAFGKDVASPVRLKLNGRPIYCRRTELF